jgi:hypothetical protein
MMNREKMLVIERITVKRLQMLHRVKWGRVDTNSGGSHVSRDRACSRRVRAFWLDWISGLFILSSPMPCKSLMPVTITIMKQLILTDVYSYVKGSRNRSAQFGRIM